MSKDENKDSEKHSLGSGKVKSYFYYGQGIQKNLIETNAVRMKHVAKKFGQITKESLMVGELVVTEVNSSKLYKFKTKEEQTEHVEKMEFWE